MRRKFTPEQRQERLEARQLRQMTRCEKYLNQVAAQFSQGIITVKRATLAISLETAAALLGLHLGEINLKRTMQEIGTNPRRRRKKKP